MHDTDLRRRLVRLAHAKPAARAALLPMLRQAAMRRTAGTPAYFKDKGLNAKAVQDNMAFQVYSIIPPGDPRAKGPRGHSKFYEVLIVKEPDAYVLHRAWGSIGDPSPKQRREEYSTLRAAQSAMNKYYRARMKPGKHYVSAWGSQHTFKDPQTGRTRKVPRGEYPLTFRKQSPGFSHGFQGETACIPALTRLVENIDAARAAIEAAGEDTIYPPDELLDITNDALDEISVVVTEDSAMGNKLKTMMQAIQRRAVGGKRFKPDPGNSRLRKALYSIRNYIVRSGGYCAKDDAELAMARSASLHLRSRIAGDRKADPSEVAVGDIFWSSWGYDQTNVDFYKVIKRTPTTVTVVQVPTEIVGDPNKPQVEVRPGPGEKPRGKGGRKKLKTYSGTPYITLSTYEDAYLWDGRSQKQTGGAYGH
jgi:hypothetical protein